MMSLRLILLYIVLNLMISSIISTTSSSTTPHKELTAREKLRKHQEWLRKRQELKARYRIGAANASDFTKFYKTQNGLNEPKLYENKIKYYDKNDPSRNDVYPEMDETTQQQQQQQQPQQQSQKLETTTPRSITATPLHFVTNENSNYSNRISQTNSRINFETTTAATTVAHQNFGIATEKPAARKFEETTTSIKNINGYDTSMLTESVIKSPLLVNNNQMRSEMTFLPPLSTVVTTSSPIVTVTVAQQQPGVRNETLASNSKRVIKKPKIKKKYPTWGPWSNWTDCSRSCGGGVMAQQRKCISKKANSTKRFISKDCVGLFRRYSLCNEQPCSSSDIDFRQQQCSNYDNVLFQGKKYEWEPYIKEDAECELNCKPIGMKYFATLNTTVIDGTSCSRPAEYYRKNHTGKAVCVDGVCKAIHGSGVITGLFANSGTIPCGGLVCRPISGIFTKDPLLNDYVHVATLPAGASNISITELKNSKNLLVLKLQSGNYAFNGDKTPSRSGQYEIGGATFDYRRIDGLIAVDGKEIEGVTEWITCLGPIRETVELMILATDTNPGIKYEYLLPILSNSEEDENSSSFESDGDLQLKSGNGEDDNNLEQNSVAIKPRRKKRFQWKVVGFSPCSKSCGGGTQTPMIRCVREIPKRFYSPKRCAHTEKPSLNENLLRCNTQPCPAYWRIDDWGDCRCHMGIGIREREIRCVQELATGIVIQVNNAACLEEEPSGKKRCECPKPSTSSKRKHHNHHNNHHNHHNRNKYHAHTRAPIETIYLNSTVAPQKQPDYNKAGTWLVSDWNQHCSAECGNGVEHRSIFCDRSPPNSDRCDLRFTPDTTRQCENERSCDMGEWFTSAWSQCSGSCFNLTRNRQVLCIRNQLIVDEDDCVLNEKPEPLQNCTFQDVDYCKPRWHYSSWTECTKKCDGGTQRRTVRCLELDIKENTLRESQRCRYSEREPIYRSCNTHDCQVPRVEMIQNDVAACNDEFANCHIAVRAKLCGHEYYQQNCCYSCNADLFDSNNDDE